MQLDLDDSYTNFVKEDIRKQLPGRIQYYFQKLSQENRNSTKEEQEQEIYYRIVSDIEQAVHTFFYNFMRKEIGVANDYGCNKL